MAGKIKKFLVNLISAIIGVLIVAVAVTAFFTLMWLLLCVCVMIGRAAFGI